MAEIDQDEALRLLEEAISAYMQFKKNYEGEFLADWTLVYSASHPEKPDITSYGTIHSGGRLPTHRVLGLLKVGMDFQTPRRKR